MTSEADTRVLLAVAKERADNADRRADAAERDSAALWSHVRRLEAKLVEYGNALARIEGASSGWAKAAPWIAIAVSAAFAVWGRMAP